MKKAYSVNYIDGTITVNSSFYEKMQDPTSEEYKLVKAIRADYPEMRIVNRTHKTPSKYTSKSTGETFNCNQFKNLTFDNMKAFIEGLPNSEKFMKSYNFLRYCGKLPQTSRYTAVRKWFVAQFPEFRKNPCSISTTRSRWLISPPSSKRSRTALKSSPLKIPKRHPESKRRK